MKGCLGCVGAIVALIVVLHIASCVFAIGSSEYEKAKARRAERIATEAKQAEIEKAQKEDAARLAEAKRKQAEAAAAAKRKQESKDAKIQEFALKDAPKVWQVYQFLQGEINVQNGKIEELRSTLVTFGKSPEEDEDFNKICAIRDDMIRTRKALRAKIEDAYIAAKKYEASPSRKDYQELHKKALEDGILEADQAEAKFREMRLNK